MKSISTYTLANCPIHRNDNFFLAFQNYFENEKAREISKLLREKEKRIDKDDFSYRIINHWEKHGLLEADRGEGKGWRKFSLLDYVWLHLLGILREFGVSIEKIKTIKESLKYLGGLEDWGLFEFYLARTAGLKDTVYFLAFQDGSTEIVLQSEYISAMNLGEIGDHIKISINQIFQRIFPNQNYTPRHDSTAILTSEELDLLIKIRYQEYEEIKIKGKDGKISMIETTTQEDTAERITEILQKGEYQSIEIKQANGKVQCIKRTVKEKK